jgi:hypothetical protein
MTYNRKIKGFIAIIAILIMATMATAIPTINWLQPSQNGEVIPTYPPQIKATITTNESQINNCTITIGNLTYLVNVSSITAEITINTVLDVGTYNTTINCTDTVTNKGESKSFIISSFATATSLKEKVIKLGIAILAIIIAIMIYSKGKKKIQKVAAGAIITVSLLSMTVIIGEFYVWAMVMVAVIVTIVEIGRPGDW